MTLEGFGCIDVHHRDGAGYKTVLSIIKHDENDGTMFDSYFHMNPH